VVHHWSAEQASKQATTCLVDDRFEASGQGLYLFALPMCAAQPLVSPGFSKTEESTPKHR
jgi:hypothetical protein